MTKAPSFQQHARPARGEPHRAADLMQRLAPLARSPVRHRNRVDVLENGEQIFPAMLDAIASARDTITFENYVWWAGEVTRRFTDAFCDRARAGVDVHVIIDWFGSIHANRDDFRRMRECGVDLRRYHPPRDILKFNRRTHRKILVVDGRIGFTGGAAIADEWDGDGLRPGNRRDTHYRLDGPIVADLQSAFFDHWPRERPLPDTLERYFPALEEPGDVTCQFYTNAPHEEAGRVRFMYRAAIRAAQRSIHIGNAYFLPDDRLIGLLGETVRRGVEVQVVVPGPHMDHKVTGAAMHRLYDGLLQAGVRLFEYQPSMYHCKTMVIDDALLVAGSGNFDERSLRLNAETNLHLYDERLARAHAEALARDRSRSEEVTSEALRRRPWWRRAAQRLAAVLRPQM